VKLAILILSVYHRLIRNKNKKIAITELTFPMLAILYSLIVLLFSYILSVIFAGAGPNLLKYIIKQHPKKQINEKLASI